MINKNKLFSTVLMFLSSTLMMAQEVAQPEVQLAENADGNRTIFWVLFVFGLFLVAATFTMSSTLSSILKSDYFRKRYSEKYNTSNGGKVVKTLVILIGLTTLPSLSHALTINEFSNEHWIDVTRSDVWMMAVIDCILLGVFLYVRSTVKSMFKEVMSDKRKVKAEQAAKQVKTFTQILTDTVAIEDEESILMDHEYDGIQELDNNLPPWWKWGFYISIVFAFIYVFHYHVFKTGDLQAQAYDMEIATANAEVQAYLEKAALNVDENSVVLLTDGEAISKGATLFKKNCAVCHGQLGEGVVGPNLTDKYWLYGGSIQDVFKTVKYGAQRGMQSWSDKLNPVELQQVSSYVLSLEFADGKEPEGEEYKPQ